MQVKWKTENFARGATFFVRLKKLVKNEAPREKFRLVENMLRRCLYTQQKINRSLKLELLKFMIPRMSHYACSLCRFWPVNAFSGLKIYSCDLSVPEDRPAKNHDNSCHL